MRRVALVVSLLVAAGGAAYALWPRPPGGALVVEPDPIDFGAVPWLESVKKTVRVTNRSRREVLLHDPKFDCPCFSLLRPLSMQRLGPGRSAEFELLIHTPKTTAGRFQKKCTIDSDDPVTPRLVVPVIGVITDFREVTPREIALGTVDSAAEPVERTIQVRGGNGYSVTLAGAQVSDPRLAVEVRPMSGGGDAMVRTVRGAAKGRIAAQVRLALDVAGADGEKHRYTDAVWVSGDVK